jgi:formylglycine-generating enzyme required for sulfatase activity
MSDHDGGEYELEDLPEEPQPKAKSKPAAEPVKPLPRLWKAEDGGGAEAPAVKDVEQSKDPVAPPSSPPRSRPKPKPAKPTVKEGREKKALIEETPALDTYEARQRGRLMLGILVPACIGIFGWIFYRLFIYDPYAMVITEEEPPVAAAPAVPKRDLDVEARSLLNRARETDKAKRTDEATKLLGVLIKSYPSTKTAAEAKEALERTEQGFPLFPEHPIVKAEAAPKPEPAAPPPPPQVVNAVPRQTQGNAKLTPPANPAELTASAASPLAMAPAADVPAPASNPVRTLPPGFRAQPSARVHESGWPLVIVGDRDGAPMLFVPGGTFTMGSDGGAASEAPAHQVRLSPYYVDQHEVTFRLFKLFLSESHHRGQPPKSWSEEFRQNPSESLPMVMVNARDAQAYADWAQKKLPTEAQWEMAARGTDGRLYPWGPDPLPAGTLRQASQPGPVMSAREDTSPYGVRDLGGNVLEWTKDWYDSKLYRSLSSGVADNPTGPTARPRSLELVVKGDRKNGSAAARQGINWEKRLNYVGFRCVLPVAEQSSPITPAQTPPAAAPPGQAPQAQPQPQPPAAPAPRNDAVPF